ncbi:hypothetical protein V8C26DRAFT_255123 [Trichoderma gracile]
MTTPPSRSSGSSSYISSTTSNEVPEEYLITSTSSLPPLSTQSFPFPPQNASSSSSMPTTKPRNLPWNPQHDSPYQPPQATTKAAPPGSSDQASSSSSTARLLHEQRLSTCLNILRHVQRTLRQRHDEATAHLTHTSDLVAQSTWDLFYQSPLDFMCHEMDMLTDDTTNAILSDKSPLGIGSSSGGRGKLSTAQESEAWMKKLDELRDLRDDEDEIKQRVNKIARQMETAKAMMRVGMAEQGVVLARSDALPSGYRYQYIYQNGLGQPPTMCVRVPLPLSCRNEEEGKMKANVNITSTKKAATVSKSSFFDWPVPATLSKGKQVAVESEGEESSGTSGGLDSPRECHGECCRHLTS